MILPSVGIIKISGKRKIILSALRNRQLAQGRIKLQNLSKSLALPNLHTILSLFKAFVNSSRNTAVIPLLSDNTKDRELNLASKRDVSLP
jgi:hypothetical protein